jgi:peroxiredoxin
LADLRTLLKPGEPVSLWAISVDSPDRSREFAASIAGDGGGKLAFPLLADPQHRVIDAYGLQDPRYARLRRAGIPYPAVYVIDKSGRVAWARIDEDYTQRPSNREIRAALDALNP